MTRFPFRPVLAAALLSMTLVAAALAQAPPSSPTPPGQPQASMPDMMKMHEQMMAAMKTADDKLDALVKQMTAATGQRKVDAVAAVVLELVQQQKASHERMAEMHKEMMGTMMGGRGMMAH